MKNTPEIYNDSVILLSTNFTEKIIIFHSISKFRYRFIN